MASPPPHNESFRDTWKRERAELEEALREAESTEEFQERQLTVEEQLERSRNESKRDPKSYCATHLRYLSYPEWMSHGCHWCYYGSKEQYNRYLESRNLDARGRPKKARAFKTIA
jgi:hypothetical protein